MLVGNFLVVFLAASGVACTAPQKTQPASGYLQPLFPTRLWNWSQVLSQSLLGLCSPWLCLWRAAGIRKEGHWLPFQAPLCAHLPVGETPIRPSAALVSHLPQGRRGWGRRARVSLDLMLLPWVMWVSHGACYDFRLIPAQSAFFKEVAFSRCRGTLLFTSGVCLVVQSMGQVTAGVVETLVPGRELPCRPARREGPTELSSRGRSWEAYALLA